MRYADRGPLERDIAHLRAAVEKAKPVDYRNEDAYLQALADVMKTEYEAIIGAGFLLQLDCPDLGSARHNQHRDKTDDMNSGGDGALLNEIRQISRSLARLSTPVVPEGRMIGPLPSMKQGFSAALAHLCQLSPREVRKQRSIGF